MYKAIFIDIDGTLRNSQRQLTSKTAEAIKKVTERGILVIICSGRPRKYTENVSKKANASRYVITSNGGSIYDYEEERVLFKSVMDKQACIELYKIAQDIGARFIMDVGENRVVNRLKLFDGSEEELKIDIETFVRTKDIIQCVVADKDFDKIKSIKPQIENLKNVAIKNQHKSLLDESIPKEGSIYYDVANKENDKGAAIKKLCSILDIDLKDTVGIGDDYNDLSMFKVVGHSVAMGNANDEIKALVDEVTASNDEDGVARFLEKILAKIEE